MIFVKVAGWLDPSTNQSAPIAEAVNIRVGIGMARYLQWRALACNQVIKEGTPVANCRPKIVQDQKSRRHIDRDHHKKKRQRYDNDAETSNNIVTFGLQRAAVICIDCG